MFANRNILSWRAVLAWLAAEGVPWSTPSVKGDRHGGPRKGKPKRTRKERKGFVSGGASI